ncbi:peptidoglycan editing factor PgeF [Pseudoruegeria sp. SK021]|uniref:peptidoglycan editing factor PgeF n=1 Tax=Pseudoruegeria sp. SK021 TaxID=1933035 RepID=UPI000A266A0E|nr:peptidoglycan editing factor PgeF [Pseudoruegeria sp. SK021]OSP54147.1 polyphenol oxidase [Pseudoruegeria sp. SK021]
MTLEILTSAAMRPVQHGFFTRKGGASSGVFSGLNCGRGSSDQTAVVEINRARVAQAMGGDPADLCGLHQVHSADVVVVDAAPNGSLPKADGAVTRTPGLILSVLTADCAPVLFADSEAGVIGAAHAGWRGALGGVLDATLDKMESLGAQRGQIRAVVGPTISQRAYEVGPDFFDQFMSEDPAYGRFFAGGTDDRMMFDLPGFCLFRLRNAGVLSAEWTHHCTYSDPSRFFSYRRSVHNKEADYGRLVTTIRL